VERRVFEGGEHRVAFAPARDDLEHALGFELAELVDGLAQLLLGGHGISEVTRGVERSCLAGAGHPDLPAASGEAAGGVNEECVSTERSSPRSGPLDAGGRPELHVRIGPDRSYGPDRARPP